MEESKRENELERLEEILVRNRARTSAKILVLSNKSGVRKIVVAVNMAVCLSRKGAMVALLDADAHGASVAKCLALGGTDSDKPFVEAYPDSEAARVVEKICHSIDEKVIKEVVP